MAQSTIAIIGSGIIGTALAYRFVQAGHDVVIFEKGSKFPYPPKSRFLYELHAGWSVGDPYHQAQDLRHIEISGDYPLDLESERAMAVGGTGTVWGAFTPRMAPSEFKRKSTFDYGVDWPIGYDDLESYYGQAEDFIGVSGSSSDNPFAQRRSKPFPLPPFELSYADKIIAEGLAKQGIRWHTSPQARTRKMYAGRPACANFGICRACPIGARYMPNHHLNILLQSGHCRLLTDVTVKRIAIENGKATTVVYQPNDSSREIEHHARIIIIAGGALETARLLLLSKSANYPDGIGNSSGHVGRHLTFHHVRLVSLALEKKIFPARFGGTHGNTEQFRDPPKGSAHGGLRVELSPGWDALRWFPRMLAKWTPGKPGAEAVIANLRPQVNTAVFVCTFESVSDKKKYVTLSETKRDRFDDPFPLVQYQSSEFDLQTYRYGTGIINHFKTATRATGIRMPSFEDYGSAGHHMSTCRMGSNQSDSVVDSFGRIHGIPNLYLSGTSIFPSSS